VPLGTLWFLAHAGGESWTFSPRPLFWSKYRFLFTSAFGTWQIRCNSLKLHVPLFSCSSRVEDSPPSLQQSCRVPYNSRNPASSATCSAAFSVHTVLVLRPRSLLIPRGSHASLKVLSAASAAACSAPFFVRAAVPVTDRPVGSVTVQIKPQPLCTVA